MYKSPSSQGPRNLDDRELHVFQKKILFLEQLTNHHHRRGQEILVVKLAAAVKRQSSQVMDWAKRQALAHHAAEEKGPTSFSFLHDQYSPLICYHLALGRLSHRK